MKKIVRAIAVVFLFILIIFFGFAALFSYPGITPKQTAEILIEDGKFGGRALLMAPFWGDALLPRLREASENYSRLNERSAQLLMVILAEKNKSEESLKLATELYQRDNVEAKVVGAAGLAAQGKLPEEALRPNGYLYEAITYNPRVNAANYKELVDLNKPSAELALIVAKYAKRNEVLDPILKILGYRHVPYFLHANACDALGEIGDKRAISDLEVAMKDQDFYAIPNAFDALLKLGDENAIPLAIKRITPDIRGKNSQLIVGELENVTGKHFGFDQKKWQEWWNQRKP